LDWLDAEPANMNTNIMKRRIWIFIGSLHQENSGLDC
jgi:hypothetical protein